MRVMVVEDERVTAFALEMALVGAGAEVVGNVGTAAAALELALRERPDVVVVDIRLKGNGDGIEVVRLLREQYPVQAAFLTASWDEDLLRRARGLDPICLEQKPMDYDEFVALLGL